MAAKARCLLVAEFLQLFPGCGKSERRRTAALAAAACPQQVAHRNWSFGGIFEGQIGEFDRVDSRHVDRMVVAIREMRVGPCLAKTIADESCRPGGRISAGEVTADRLPVFANIFPERFCRLHSLVGKSNQRSVDSFGRAAPTCPFPTCDL